MKNLHKIAFSVTMAISGMVATTAQASKWYYGIGGGKVDLRNFDDAVIQNGTITGTNSYSNGVGATVTVGRNIKGPFSIEANYTRVKDHDLSIEANDSSITSDRNLIYKSDVKMKQNIYNVSAVYRHNLNNTFYAKAKVGVSYYDLKVKSATFTNTNGTQDITAIFSNKINDKIELVGGVGVGARISSCCNVEVSYDSTADYQSVQGALIWHF